MAEIRFSLSSHTARTDPPRQPHLPFAPSGWHCVIWCIRSLDRVCPPRCWGSRSPPLGYPRHPLIDAVTFETHSPRRKEVLSVEKCAAHKCPLSAWRGLVWTNLIESEGAWFLRGFDPIFLSMHHTTALSMVFSFDAGLDFVAFLKGHVSEMVSPKLAGLPLPIPRDIWSGLTAYGKMKG